MRTFSIHTLGCRVNHYESEQIAAALRDAGLVQVDSEGDVRVVHTCSVTSEAASKSRQFVRRATRLPVLHASHAAAPAATGCGAAPLRGESIQSWAIQSKHPSNAAAKPPRPRVIVTGCWATSDRAEAAGISGVDAVLTHHDNVARELARLLRRWSADDQSSGADSTNATTDRDLPPESLVNEGWMTKGGHPADDVTDANKPRPRQKVKDIFTPIHPRPRAVGTTSLPLLGQRQAEHQRAFLKVQDGCDAHCTYCIIPTLRPSPWSKPVEAAVDEAKRLVAAGHVEIVLTGIFLGAYGQPTALRRRQPRPTAEPLGELVEALCTHVPGLHRLRLSSLEPGDVTPELLEILRRHREVVPHFHLPLQSGSDAILRRMNRQYTSADFLRLVEQLRSAFDRPALTTDIIVGFPGEGESDFQQTLRVVDAARFIHIHAFPFSPRPGTAAARWTKEFVAGRVANERMAVLRERAAEHSFAFRQSFIGENADVLVERTSRESHATSVRHGRCERYFDVCFDGFAGRAGECVRVRIDRVTRDQTFGSLHP